MYVESFSCMVKWYEVVGGRKGVISGVWVCVEWALTLLKIRSSHVGHILKAIGLMSYTLSKIHVIVSVRRCHLETVSEVRHMISLGRISVRQDKVRYLRIAVRIYCIRESLN